MRFRSRFDNHQNFLILFHSSRKQKEIMFTFEIDHFDWLSQFYSEWWETSKLVNLKFSAKLHVYELAHNWKMTKTSKFCSIHQGNTSKSCLHWNLIILTHSHSFTVNDDKLQNESIFKISAKVRVYDLGQNLIMIKTSWFCSIHQGNTRKSCLHSNLIILTDLHSFTVNDEKLQN